MSDIRNMKSQVDYILVNNKWINSIKDNAAFNTYASLGSDHRVLRARVKISLRKCKSPKRTNYDWSVLRNPSDLQTRYSISVQNRFNALSGFGQDATQRYGNLIQANNETAEELIPEKKRKENRRTSCDPRIIHARNNVRKAYSKFQKEQTPGNESQLQIEKAALQTAYNYVLEEELANDICQLENLNATNRHAESWKLVNSLTDRKQRRNGILEGKDKEERVKNWYNHFKQLLGQEPVIEDEEVDVITVIDNMEFKRNSAWQNIRKRNPR